jgi:DNA-binding NarL/FixJ family response regulator
MAEGLSKGGIGRRLFASAKTVEAHVKSIFTKRDWTQRRTTTGARPRVLKFVDA